PPFTAAQSAALSHSRWREPPHTLAASWAGVSVRVADVSRTPMVKHSGAPDAGNLHVRCDEGKGARHRASFLLYRDYFFSSRAPLRARRRRALLERHVEERILTDGGGLGRVTLRDDDRDDAADDHCDQDRGGEPHDR